MAPLVTAAELKTYMQRPIDDAAAALAVAGASGAVRARCGWEISEVTETLKIDGSGTPVLNLPTMRLSAVTAVRIDGAAYTEWTSTNRGQLLAAGAGDFWPAFARIEVDCTHGYPAVPDVVRLVTFALAARQVANPERLKSAAVGSISRVFDLSDLDIRLLDPYRLP